MKSNIIKLSTIEYRYPESLIKAYINAEDIEGYDVKELEDCAEFMEDVIRYTNDKNMYNLCSQRLKNDYTFIRFVIEHFSYEKQFIEKIADEYFDMIDSLDDGIDDTEAIESVELSIIMSKYSNKVKYKAKAYAFFLTTCVDIELSKIQENDNSTERFIFAQVSFNSDIVIEYFAKKFIETILFKNDDFSFEDILHSNFYNFSDLKNYGIKRFLIDYIMNHDGSLGNYVISHQYLIDDILEKMDYFEKRWPYYVEEKIMILYEALIDFVFDNDLYVDVLQLAKFALDTLNIKYDREELLNRNSLNLESVDRRIKKQALRIAKNIFCNSYTKQEKSNIIKVDFKQKKIIK